MTESTQNLTGDAVPSGRRFRRAVVLGGAGFVGSHLCEALITAGTSVLCVDNFLTGSADNVAVLVDEPGFQLVEHDATAPLNPALLVEPIDLVLHLASPASPLDYLRHPLQTLRAGSYATEQGLDTGPRPRRPISAGLHQRGLRRRRGAPATRDLRGQRQPDRTPQRLRRSQAVRRGTHLRLPPDLRRRRGRRPHLQHLRHPDAAR